MNSNMTVGPSFQGTFQLKKVECLVEGHPVYSKAVEEIKLPATEDRAINSGLACLLGGKINETVLVTKDRLESSLGYISWLINKPLVGLFKADKTLALGNVSHPTNMTFSLKNADVKAGDVHLFWKSDIPYDTIRFSDGELNVAGTDSIELVREARFGK